MVLGTNAELVNPCKARPTQLWREWSAELCRERPNKDSRKKDEEDKSPKTNRRLSQASGLDKSVCYYKQMSASAHLHVRKTLQRYNKF